MSNEGAVIAGTSQLNPIGMNFDRSDHAPYWRRRTPAMLLTDTGPMRGPRYHRRSDTPETLDYPWMASIVTPLTATLPGCSMTTVTTRSRTPGPELLSTSTRDGTGREAPAVVTLVADEDWRRGPGMDSTKDTLRGDVAQSLARAHALVEHAMHAAGRGDALADATLALHCGEVGYRLVDAGAIPDADLLSEPMTGTARQLLTEAADVLDAIDEADRPVWLLTARAALTGALSAAADPKQG